jgi:hypothetical protein
MLKKWIIVMSTQQSPTCKQHSGTHSTTMSESMKSESTGEDTNDPGNLSSSDLNGVKWRAGFADSGFTVEFPGVAVHGFKPSVDVERTLESGERVSFKVTPENTPEMAQELAKWEKFDRYMQSPEVAEMLFGKSAAQARYVPCAIRDPETGCFISRNKKRYLEEDGDKFDTSVVKQMTGNDVVFGKDAAKAGYIPCVRRDPDPVYFISGCKKRYLGMSDLMHQHRNRRCRVWRKN